jgi:hypothetical protein
MLPRTACRDGNGMRVFFSQRRVVSPSPQALHSAQSPYSTAASVRPQHVLPLPRRPTTARQPFQLRVLRTQTKTKGAQYLSQYPDHSAPLLNWSSTVHRKRHFAPAAMTSHTQTRDHAGHHHHHDNTFLLSKNKNDAGVRITRIGLYVNLGMAVSKGFGGYVFNSQGETLNMQFKIIWTNIRQHSSPMPSTVSPTSSATS